MGLDMYLDREIYIGAEYEHRGIAGEVNLTVSENMHGSDRPEPIAIPINVPKIATITERVGYWRKANAIHNWFVEKCQKGVDECQNTSIDLDQLKKLKAECDLVLENPEGEEAQETLEPKSGFFFGSTDRDQYYREDLQQTVEIIDKLIEEHDKYPSGIYATYTYHSSW